MSNDPRAAAERLLDKLHWLVVEELDREERAMFAALIAPAITSAYEGAEVEGFGVSWSSAALPDALAAAVRDRHVRIDGL